MVKINISIIVPAYNEEKRGIENTIIKIIQYLKKRRFNYELIVVDDGSKDNTFEVISKLAKKNKKIRILKNGINRGKGYSIKKGILNAKKELILFSDADLATPIEELDKLLKYVPENDIVIASRRMKKSNIITKQPWYRRLMGGVFPLIVNLIAINNINDTQCGFKLFKKSIVNDLFKNLTIFRWGWDVEILYIAQKHKLKIKEVPVKWIDVEGSKLNPIKDSLKMLKDVVKVKMNGLRGMYK